MTLPDNTQLSQQTNIHAAGGIRKHDLSRRAAVDLRLRPRGYWERQRKIYPRNAGYICLLLTSNIELN